MRSWPREAWDSSRGRKLQHEFYKYNGKRDGTHDNGQTSSSVVELGAKPKSVAITQQAEMRSSIARGSDPLHDFWQDRPPPSKHGATSCEERSVHRLRDNRPSQSRDHAPRQRSSFCNNKPHLTRAPRRNNRERSRSRSRSIPRTSNFSVRRSRGRSKNHAHQRRSRSRSRRKRRSRSPSQAAEKHITAIEKALLHVDCDALNAVRMAQKMSLKSAGFMCHAACARRLQSLGEQRLLNIREEFYRALESVNQALGVEGLSAVLKNPKVSDGTELSIYAQQWRAQVLARHVARLGDRGAALQQSVQAGTTNDAHWKFDYGFYELAIVESRNFYKEAITPRSDRKICERFGLGTSIGPELSRESVPWEAWAGHGREDAPKPEGLFRTVLMLSEICWSHSTISESFREKGTILQTAVDLLRGALLPTSLPVFEVIHCKSLAGERGGTLGGPRWWALSGNRRLAALRLASFFDPSLKYVQVKIIDAAANPGRLGALLTGSGRGPPKLTSKMGGQFVTVRETGEVIGKRLSGDTYGADLLWLIFKSREPPPPVEPGRASFLAWREKLTNALHAAGGRLRLADLKLAMSENERSNWKHILAVIPEIWLSKSSDWITLRSERGSK